MTINLTTSTIHELEDRLRQAMLDSDADALDDLLAEDVIFTNQDGAVLTKSADLEVHRSGKLSLNRLDVDERRISLIEGGAIVSVRVHLAGSYESLPFSGAFRYTRIWTRSNGRMRVAAAHCSAIS